VFGDGINRLHERGKVFHGWRQIKVTFLDIEFHLGVSSLKL